ncbi:uncharacterized protein LOC124138636 [Haliotis rufescens]|uniref:uncharacterized protein LOC124138636 n=1 Tax=Haliotis rufescens TaxID=6454 RepID=UPI00201F958F|nr:uncharacterized protein LOC124138636 [Haliotis rufescens]
MGSRTFGALYPVRAGHGIICVLFLASVSMFGYLYLYNSSHMLQPRRSSFLLNTSRHGFIANFQLPFYTKPYWTRDIKEANDSLPVTPLLTMFTSWPSNDKKYEVRNITLKNWANLRPHIRPVFFSTNENDTKDIIQHGWEVLPVTKIAASGVPVLKYMYLDVIRKFKSKLYGYSNGDILFDDGLIRTLRTVVSSYFPPSNPILIIGQRTNVLRVTADEGTNMDSLSTIARQRGKLFLTVAEDYFITDSTFPWGSIPGIVIGRPAYDNWLVLNSRQHNHTVVDATASILAVHQTTKAGNFEGRTRKNSNYNAGLLRNLYKSIKYAAGATSCAPLVTKRNETGVYISQRTTFKKTCNLYYKSLGLKTKLVNVTPPKNE